MKNTGILQIESVNSFEECCTRIEKLLKEKGFHIFAQIDHSKSAAQHGRSLHPTRLFIFGNPETGGTGLMQENQEIGIDLPAKILIWRNRKEKVYISYNDFNWLAQRHRLSTKNQAVIQNLHQQITGICRTAANS